jgi:hypothetical protein
VFFRPVVIATAPVLDDGSPFPTLYWLTCPWLVSAAAERESAGGASAWQERFEGDPALADRMRAADTEYRRRRAGELRFDPVPDVGIAGQSDPLATKCLHAHAAAYIAGIDDPVGEWLVHGAGRACPDDRCSAHAKADES